MNNNFFSTTLHNTNLANTDNTVSELNRNLLRSAYVYSNDITVVGASGTWGGWYSYFDIRTKVNEVSPYEKVVAIIPLCANLTTDAGYGALIANYSYDADIRSTAFVLNAGKAGTYRAKFLVLYNE